MLLRRGFVAACAGLVACTLVVAGSAAARSTKSRAAEPIVTSPTRASAGIDLDRRLLVVQQAIDRIGIDMQQITMEARDLAASIRMADTHVQQAKHELGRETAEATEAAAVSSLSAAAASAMASALIEPLQEVSGAMVSKDAYTASLLRALSDTHRRESAVAALADRTRSLRAELEVRRNDLDHLLSDTVREVHGPGASSARQLSLTAIRLALTRVGELLQVAETADADLHASSIRLTTHEEALLGQLKRADASGQDLQDTMVTVERFVGLAFPGVTLTAETPVIGGILHVCPVDQPHSYSDDFGAPRWAGGYHPHQGNDIFAPEGTPIRAPFDGLAVKTPNTLGGQAVTVYGESGYVYNAHLSEYGKVGRVTTGTIIGYVGNTGDAINSAPHDHFEWHPSNGDAVDPYPYLNAVCLLPQPITNDTSSP
jgi:murein DD-endopeptidase MepM/ murein hydrolase activator NlpD